MKSTLIHFLGLQPRNVTSEIHIAMAIIYGAMVVATLHSILHIDSTPRSKAIWAVIVIALPILGIAAYCVSSLRKADYSFLQTIGFMRKPKQQF